MNFSESGHSVKLAVIGLGGRGFGWVQSLLEMKDVDIVAVCDEYEDRTERACQFVLEKRGVKPVKSLDYRQLLTIDEVEACLVFTNWESHISIAIDCMKAGKRVGMEVCGSCSVQECWDLVHASEQTGMSCMFLENCCYGREEMALLNMVRMGIFGEVVHCQGGYEHDLRDEIGNGDIKRHYRQEHFMNRNADLYPTHAFGPIAKLLKINRGNQMLSLCSMSSKAAGLKKWYHDNRADSEWAGQDVMQGDIVTTMIRCAQGETILLTHDCTLPRPYSRGGRVQGTSGIWMEDNHSIYIEGMSQECHTWEDAEPYMTRYEHPLWKAFKESEKNGGHGGMDYLVMRAFVESVQGHKEPPIDVYDAAAWMCITALSAQSIAMGGTPVAIPDFTNGRWLRRRPTVQGQYDLM